MRVVRGQGEYFTQAVKINSPQAGTEQANKRRIFFTCRQRSKGSSLMFDIYSFAVLLEQAEASDVAFS